MIIPLAERLARMERWLARENDRPLIGFQPGSYFPLQAYPGSMRHLPDGLARPEDVVVEDYLEDTERLFRLHEELGGDLLWSASPFVGLPWVEAALGCGVVADYSQGCTRSLPPPDFASHPIVPEFDESNPWVSKMLEFIPALEAQSGGRYPVGVTLMRGPADLLSALYGGDAFIYRLLDEPGEVDEVVRRVTDFWIALGRRLLERLPLFHGGTAGLGFGLWCPGKMIWFQEDAAALLSPALYERFILPADCRITEAFEHTFVHLHPARLVPSLQLAKTRVDAIELNIDCGGPGAEQQLPCYRAILERKPLLVWGEVTADDMECMLKQLPHRGLALNVLAHSPEEARLAWDRAQALFG